jgi:hypothetical protein
VTAWTLFIIGVWRNGQRAWKCGRRIVSNEYYDVL